MLLKHGLAIFALLGFAFEVYRTIQNFGKSRGGIAGGVVELPAAHMVLALLLGCVGLFVVGPLSPVPNYVGPLTFGISMVYFVAALRHRQRRSRVRRERNAKRT